MLVTLNIRRIMLARYKVDFRKGHDGLLAEAYKLGLKPMAGDVVIFLGRDKRRLKVLYADSNGLWVSYKRFNGESMKSSFKFLADAAASRITTAELTLLLDGAHYEIHGRLKDDPENSD